MARRKSDAQPVPQTTAEAVEMIALYGEAERSAATRRLVAEAAIADIQAGLAADLAWIEERQKPRFAAIKAWWEAGGNAAGWPGRSAEIAGVTLGVRLTPPKLKLPRGMTGEAVIKALIALPARMGFAVLRKKYEVDRQAILSLLRRPPENDGLPDRLFDMGFKAEQRDEFYIDAGIDLDALHREIGIEQGTR